ncbi:MAG: hypothetical protein ACI9OJ_001220 [Myxococcota bacterium]|jgi:hypothetical protein
MIRTMTAWAGAAMVGTSVTGYWAYTLLGVDGLAPWMLKPRRRLALAGAGLSGVSLVGLPSVTVAGGATVAAGLLAYSARNQWLFPKVATRLKPSRRTWSPDELVAVVNGAAIPVRWASKLRTVQVNGVLVVHCGLARSLVAFDDPGTPLGAVLPHPTGFDIAALDNMSQRFDGVDGRSYGGVDLKRRAIRLTRLRDAPGAVVVAPASDSGPPAPHRRTPRLPGARGIANARDWGIVEGGVWTAVEIGNAPTSDDGYYLSRWAAIRRGLL